MTEFFRFPHTHHLIWLGEGEPRGDKVLLAHEVTEMLQNEIIIEEKLDGANLGISLDDNGQLQAQNRGSYLEQPFNGQFSRLNSWLGQYDFALKDFLTPDLILFGEWCAAQHSLDYHALPDWFLLFDVYDRRQEKFWSVARRNELATTLGLSQVPELGRGHFDKATLTKFLETATSRYRAGQVEGIVIRQDSQQWNEARAKFVNKNFVQAIEEHWRSRTMQWNQVAQLPPNHQ
ncbi:MAG: RNA ligase family protein [Gammaproteobacteria bacterium]|nr:RNA ligase family protein [Gammaproteobacteria bacterium]MDP2346539.1 RNA ligase family protein [Gammaproteobacteria bacterium]